MRTRTLFSLIGLLTLPAPGRTQEPWGYPDVWRSATTHPCTPGMVQALIGLLGPGVEHRMGGCFVVPEWGKGSKADEAAGQLVECGNPAIPHLLPLLGGKEPKLRRLVVEILGRIGNRSVTPSLLPLLQSETDDGIRQSVAESVAMLRDVRAEAPLIQALQDKSKWVQQDAARGLGWLKSTRAIAPLAALLRKQTEPSFAMFGRSPQVGATVAAALGKIGTPALPALLDILVDPTTSATTLADAIPPACVADDRRVIAIVQRLLESPNDAVRNVAVNSLAKWPDALPVPTLAHLLHGPQGQTLYSAGMLLAVRGDKASRDALEKALASANEWERLAASVELQYITSPDGIPMLIRALQTGGAEAKHHAAITLGTLKDKRALSPLLTALTGPDVELRRMSAAALGYFDDPRILDPLLLALDDPEVGVRIQALTALREKQDPRLMPAFERLLKDGDPSVRANAAYAIQMQQKAALK